MEYIDHSDFKRLMSNLQKGAPKGLLNEMHSMDHDGADEHKHLPADAEESLEKEGNAFTAGLAKAKKGQAFKVGDKAVKDTSNYDSSLEEYQFDQMYPDDPGPFEGEMDESHPANDKWYEDFENGLQNLVKNGYMHKSQYQYFRDALDHVDPMQDYGHMPAHDAAKEFVDDLRTKDAIDHEEDQWKQEHGGYDAGGDDFNDGEFWENEVKKLQEIAGVGPQDDGPEDDNDEEREKRAKKAEMDDEEAENAEKEIDEEEMEESLNEGSNYNKIITALKARGITYDMPEKEIIKAMAEVMVQEAGYTARETRYYLGYDEDFIPDLLQALKDSEMEEGLHMPPLQATGQTIMANEDQAPFGMSVLSPDERKQLKEYINSYKTIKTEIGKLLKKAGKTGSIMENAEKVADEKVPAERKAKYKDPTAIPTHHKHSNLGGDRTGLVMTKAEMWENEEGEHDRIESMLDTKLHDAFHKVTGMIMKDLMADGFDEGDIKNFLQHEIDEKAREAINAQHDF